MLDDSAIHPSPGEALGTVPLFPLPNVVLLPRAVLPLHIFEERYKAMVANALNGDKRLAIALLLPGWEKAYSGQPKINPIVCVGTIISHEKLPDGKYNLLLQGSLRARVMREVQKYPYRIADLESLPESSVMEIDMSNERRRLISVLSNDPFCNMPVCRKFLELLSGSLRTGEIADLIAYNLLEDLDFKQQLLGETDPRRRAGRVVAALESGILSRRAATSSP
jgi:Lon protease-like protein